MCDSLSTKVDNMSHRIYSSTGGLYWASYLVRGKPVKASSIAFHCHSTSIHSLYPDHQWNVALGSHDRQNHCPLICHFIWILLASMPRVICFQARGVAFSCLSHRESLLSVESSQMIMQGLRAENCVNSLIPLILMYSVTMTKKHQFLQRRGLFAHFVFFFFFELLMSDEYLSCEQAEAYFPTEPLHRFYHGFWCHRSFTHHQLVLLLFSVDRQFLLVIIIYSWMWPAIVNAESMHNCVMHNLIRDMWQNLHR